MLLNSFNHLVVCLTTGPKPLPKRALHIVRSRASSFKWEYSLLSLGSSSSFVRLLLRLSVTSIPPFIFPLVTRCRRQFPRKMWPIQFAFRLRISCRIFLCSLTLSNTSSVYNSVSKFYFKFIWSSTCFGRHTAHHQEPKLHRQPLVLHTWRVAGQRPATTRPATLHWFYIRGGLLDVYLLDSVQQIHVQ